MCQPFAEWPHTHSAIIILQAGVFISRSSGTVFQAGRRVLWAMPALQMLLLLAFFDDAVYHIW